MDNEKTIEIELPNYFCPDCSIKDKIAEIAVIKMIGQD